MTTNSLMLRTLLGCCWFAVGYSSSHAQWQAQVTQSRSDFRGLCAVDRNVAWASGTKGTFLRTTDGGETWHVGQVPGAEELDFRDVEALDGQTAWLLSVGNGPESRLYKTTDAGKHWTLQFRNERPEAFFDALAFWNAQCGIAFSDPVDGQFLIITTTNGGTSWEPIKASIPAALPSESAFAASGTCLVVQGQSNAWFATGGSTKARVFRSADRGQTWSVSDTPVRAGTNSAGIFSLAFRDERHGVAIGGDYVKPEQTGENLAFTRDGGQTWQPGADFFPRGFRSAVSWVRAGDGWWLVAVGPSGSDVATPDGQWRRLDDEKYNTLSVARFDPNAMWAAGPQGRIARLLHLSK
jgi:photosystem II stability/assembly factor-like uncharacterized protein